MILYDQNKRQIAINDVRLAGGGEGDIHIVSGSSNKIAKLYHDNVLQSAKIGAVREKIEYMVQFYEHMRPDIQRLVTKQITWPESILFDHSGRFRGYTMAKVSDHETLDCAYLESQSTQCDFSFAEKVCIAKNLCAVVSVMHSHLHCVVGDFNARNIMVSIKKGTVYLVDSDSFHLQYTKVVRERQVKGYLPTTVGRPEYLPREMHDYLSENNATLENVRQPSFNQESDLFGLAIHIFQLLMNGVHPYGLAINPAQKTDSFSVSKADITWASNIKRGYYVYSNNSNLKKLLFHYMPPKYAPPYDVIPKNIQELFERAFVPDDSQIAMLKRKPGDGKYFMQKSVRPSAEEWYYALNDFSRNLQQCPKNPRHQFGKHQARCPWCNF